MVLVPQTLTWPLYMCSSIIPFTKCSCRLKFITATWCRSTASGVCGARQKFENFLVTLVPRIALVATTKVVGFARRPMPVGIIAVIRPQLGSWGSQAVYRIWSVPPSPGRMENMQLSADFSIGPCEYGSKLGTNCCGWLCKLHQITKSVAPQILVLNIDPSPILLQDEPFQQQPSTFLHQAKQQGSCWNDYTSETALGWL